jgi:molybdate transport system substrate-binding protein
MKNRFALFALLLALLVNVLTLLTLLTLLTPFTVSAQEKLRVAVAANYIQAFNEMAAGFEAKTGVKIEGTFSSSGNFYAQITNGAPYDLFLSADEDRPARLYKDGLAEKPFVYATGRVVLWSARKGFCTPKNWQNALKQKGVKKIAVANPVTAPYGAAAKAALEKASLWEPLKEKIVTAQDIAQSFQYASTQAVDAGFCALSATVSSEGKKGCFYPMEEAPAVVQSACVLKRTKSRAAAERFAAYLQSPDADRIKEKLGYR